MDAIEANEAGLIVSRDEADDDFGERLCATSMQARQDLQRQKLTADGSTSEIVLQENLQTLALKLHVRVSELKNYDEPRRANKEDGFWTLVTDTSGPSQTQPNPSNRGESPFGLSAGPSDLTDSRPLRGQKRRAERSASEEQEDQRLRAQRFLWTGF